MCSCARHHDPDAECTCRCPEHERPDFYITGPVLAPAFVALARGLTEVYPDARLMPAGEGSSHFAVILGEMADPLPEWMQ